MNKALDHIQKAYEWSARIMVSGDAVDCMALTRQELREAMRLLEEKENTNGQTD